MYISPAIQVGEQTSCKMHIFQQMSLYIHGYFPQYPPPSQDKIIIITAIFPSFKEP